MTVEGQRRRRSESLSDGRQQQETRSRRRAVVRAHRGSLGSSVPLSEDAGTPGSPLRLVRPGPFDQGSAGRTGGPMAVVGLLVGLVGASLALRLGDLDSWLWMDEGISVGVASHPLSDIPGLLRQDGSPPLYYLILHGWMALFGASEIATHALSLTVSLAAIPVALWAGWSLFGRRVGWTFAALVAMSPFLAYFATETRMYALLSLLTLVATASFLHGFAFGRRRYLGMFAPALALVLYTHNWGLWLTAGLLVALVPCAKAAVDRRRFWLDATLTFGAVGVAYLPWLPTLAYQRAHTGAPWSSRPVLREMVSVVAVVLGDTHERVLVVLVLVAAPALWVLLRRRESLRPSLLALALIAVVPVAIGWLGAQVSPSWAPRYLAVCVPAMLLLAALGLAHGGTRGKLALALILVFWVQPLGRVTGLRPPSLLDAKADVKSLAEAVKPGLDTGDLVVAMQMEEVPVLAYYLPAGLRFATAMGLVEDPGVADWRNALTRMEAATPARSIQPQLDAAPVSSKVLLVCAQPGAGPSTLPWFAQMTHHCTEWQATLAADGRFTPVPAVAPDGLGGVTSRNGTALRGRQVLAFTKTTS